MDDISDDDDDDEEEADLAAIMKKAGETQQRLKLEAEAKNKAGQPPAKPQQQPQKSQNAQG